jgi:hypothetical protein
MRPFFAVIIDLGIYLVTHPVNRDHGHPVVIPGKDKHLQPGSWERCADPPLIVRASSE